MSVNASMPQSWRQDHGTRRVVSLRRHRFPLMFGKMNDVELISDPSRPDPVRAQLGTLLDRKRKRMDNP